VTADKTIEEGDHTRCSRPSGDGRWRFADKDHGRFAHFVMLVNVSVSEKTTFTRSEKDLRGISESKNRSILLVADSDG
jgi:hypothetical protein